MNRHFAFCVLGLLIFGAHSLSGALPPDAEATTKLIGEWKISGGKAQVVSNGDFVFKNDGNFLATVDIVTPISGFRVEFEGKWQVKDGVLTEEITKSSDPKRVKTGHVSRDTLLEVTDKSFQTRTESGNLESYARR